MRAVIVRDRDGLPVPAKAGRVLGHGVTHGAGAGGVDWCAFVAG
jgi:hypothetical protein